MSRRAVARSSPAMEWKARDLRPAPSSSSSSAENGRYSRPAMAFVAYLPQGDENASEAKEISDHLNRQLGRLLRMEQRRFWQEVSSNESLHEFLESYLVYRRRWYDLRWRAGSEDDDNLSRRVFMVLLRMCSDEDPGGSSMIPTAKFRTKDMLSVPKLLNVCAIYGRDNAELTRRLVSTVFKSQPSHLRALSDVSRQIIATINGICDQSVGSKSNLNPKDEPMKVVALLHDTVMTLSSFVEIYPAAAGIFLSSEPAGGKNMLFALSRVYNSLLPSIRKQQIGTDLSSYLDSLQRELISFAWALLSNAFFGDTTTRIDSKVNGEVFMDSLLGLSSGGDEDILHCLSNMFDLSGNIHKLLRDGLIFLDDSQYAQLLSLLPDMPLTEEKRSSTSKTNTSQQKDEEVAIRQSHITQIKDLFPDYEDSFVSACLEVYDNNPEAVIQHILDGTVHPDIISAPARSSAPSIKDKGKAKLVDDRKQTAPIRSSDPKGKAKMVVEDQTGTQTQTLGRFVRKGQNRDEDSAKVLNEKDAGASSQTANLAMQLMYEDEYDDSFDDLGTNVADAGLETDSLVNLFSRKKIPFEDRSKPGTEPGRPKAKPDAPRFFVKDGKHYNYKVEGSVAVSSLEEAEALRKEEEGLIHGLGRGGNVPVSFGKVDDGDDDDDDGEENDTGKVDGDVSSAAGFRQQPATGQGRGQPPHRQQFWTRKKHNKKDLSLKKHMSALRSN